MKRDFRKQGFSVSKCQWSAPGLKVAHGVVVISVPGVYDSVDYDVVVLTCNLIRAPDFKFVLFYSECFIGIPYSC